MDLRHALPETFDFYNQGHVEMGPPSTGLGITDDLSGSSLLAYSLRGDVHGYLVIGYESGLDASMYMELGNVLGGQLCTRLSQEAIDVMLGPPKEISSDQVMNVLSTAEVAYAQEYLHMTEANAVRIRAFIFTFEGAGAVGNA